MERAPGRAFSITLQSFLKDKSSGNLFEGESVAIVVDEAHRSYNCLEGESEKKLNDIEDAYGE